MSWKKIGEYHTTVTAICVHDYDETCFKNAEPSL